MGYSSVSSQLKHLQRWIVTQPRNPARFYTARPLVANVTSFSKNNMQDLLFDFISRYISLTEEEKDAVFSLDLFKTVKKGTILRF